MDRSTFSQVGDFGNMNVSCENNELPFMAADEKRSDLLSNQSFKYFSPLETNDLLSISPLRDDSRTLLNYQQ